MSMILDALSRAEQERKESTEGIYDATRYAKSGHTKDDRAKRWILVALACNVILLSAFAVYYFLQDDSKKETPTAVPTEDPLLKPYHDNSSAIDESAPVTASKPAKPSTKTMEQKTVVQKRAIKPSSSLQQEFVVERVRKISKEEAIGAADNNSARVTVAAEPLTNEIVPPTIPPELNEYTNTNEYLSINELSSADKSKLRSYEINVHVYDNQVEERFVLVNMKRYKQGDRLPGGGPVIEEITPDGLVMEYAQGKVLLKRN